MGETLRNLEMVGIIGVGETIEKIVENLEMVSEYEYLALLQVYQCSKILGTYKGQDTR